MPATTSATHTGDSYIDGVIYGTKWATTSLTFSFPTSASTYGSVYGSGEPGSNFEAFNATQQAAVRATLGMYSAVANVTFAEVTETASTHADLRYAMSDMPGTAWAYMPTSLAEGGDAWFNNSSGWYDNPILGNYAFASIVHETGHALGFKHPHQASGSFAAMPADHDSLEYSVMSYRSYIGASTSTGYTNGSSSYPQSLMMYDVAAIQALYGANYATNAGNTVYSWSPTSGQTLVNGVAIGTVAGNKIFLTLWDGGGTDTYSFAGYTTTVTVNLNPGAWSTASATQLASLGSGHVAAGNIANALLYDNNTASLIENAIGGSAGDTLVGNAANNMLTGGAGNDSIDGQGGTNTAVFSGSHLEYLQIQNLNGTWTVTDLRLLSGDGIDTLANIQYLKFSDGTFAVGALTLVNHAPVANADSYSAAANTALTVNAASGVLANDTDADGTPLTAVLVSGPANGTLSLAANGGFTFTPTANWSGTTSFTYKASDGTADSATQTATITVAAPVVVNHAPVATADAYSTAANTALTVSAASGLLANDTDSDGNALTAMLVSGPANGSLSLGANGGFTFTPTSGWSGTTSFAYKASDGTTTSANQTATITVAPPVNHAPVANADVYSTAVSTRLTVSAASGVLANDTDADGNTLTATLVTRPANGTISLASDGHFTFNPKKGWSGTTSFTYKISDGTTTSANQTVTITVAANHAPVAKADAYSTAANTALTVSAASGVLANDTDSDGNALTAALVSGPANGSLSLSSNGGFTFTPTTNWSGTTSFTYKASDGKTTSANQTATITVAPPTVVNHAPVANADAYSTAANTALNVSAAAGVLGNDTDSDGNALTAVLVSGPANGTLSLAANGGFTFTPTSGWSGTTSFAYKASDGTTTSANQTATITVAPPTVVNHAPVANADLYSASANTALTVSAAAGVLANDTDSDGNALTAVLVAGPANGTLSLAANGGFTFTPTTGWSGTTSFTYKASDGTTTSANQTATITVAPPVAGNHAPVAKADTYSTNINTNLSIAAKGVLANDTDSDGNALAAVLVAGPANGTLGLSADGGFVFTPKANWTGTTSFTYQASDGSLTSANTTVTISVVAPNSRQGHGAPPAADNGPQEAAALVDDGGTLDLNALFGGGHDTTSSHGHSPLAFLVDLLEQDRGDEGPLDVHDMPAPAGWLPDLPDHLHHSHSEFALG